MWVTLCVLVGVASTRRQHQQSITFSPRALVAPLSAHTASSLGPGGGGQRASPGSVGAGLRRGVAGLLRRRPAARDAGDGGPGVRPGGGRR